MSEITYPLPWDTSGPGVFSGENLIADAESNEGAHAIVAAANAMQPRLVSEHGLPNGMSSGFFVCWCSNDNVPFVCDIADINDGIKEIFAWLPIQPLPQNPFEVWWKSNVPQPEHDDDEGLARAAWDAATAAAAKK